MMQPLSAADAFGPAWRHTRQLVFAPRRLGTFLKLTLLASLAGMAGSGYNFTRGMRNQPAHTPAVISSAMHAMMHSFLIVFILAIVVFSLALFYIGSRLQFVLFECVLRVDRTIGPIWRRYGAATWHWIGVRVLCIVLYLVCLGPVLIPFLIRMRHAPSAQGRPIEMLQFFSGMMGYAAVLFVASILFGAFFILLLDFGLPSMALESTSLRETVARIGRLVQAEPGQVALYIVLRMVVGFVLVMAAEVVVVLAGLIVGIPLGIAGFAAWKLIPHAGMGGKVLAGLIIATLALGFLALLFTALMAAVGYVILLMQSYALFFLGGRYPMVGQYMERYLPQPVYPPLQPWQPAYNVPPAPPGL